jgi:hypothetical protein
MIDKLIELKAQIERDLRVAADPEDNESHLQALNATELLIDYLL